jgi:fucose 4-O-acetylase-like acetyltransferase
MDSVDEVSTADAAPSPPARVAVPSGRNDVIDALKFFAIALVILTHVLRLRREFIHLSPDLLRIIVSFNLPLFALLSGWVLAGREGTDPLRFMKGKALALLVPYLAWIAVEMPLRHVPPAGYFARLGNALLNPMHGMQMWFLWTLFWMFAVFTLGRLVSRADWLAVALAVAVGCIALLIPGGANGLNRIAWLYPYLVLGYLVSKRRAKLRRFDGPATALAVLAFAALSVLNNHALFAQFATGTAGAVAACGIFRYLPAAASRVLAPLGKRTLGIYGAQMVVFPFLVVGQGWPGAFASWAIVLSASTAVALVLDRFAFTRAVFLGQWPRKTRR